MAEGLRAGQGRRPYSRTSPWAIGLRPSVCVFAAIMLLCAAASSAQQVPKGQMPTLGRPTESGDAVPLFDFDTYFLGKWTFEWSMPESTLGPAGPYTGTTVVSKVDGRFYEAVTEGEGPSGPFKVR